MTTVQSAYSSPAQVSRKASQSSMTMSRVWTALVSKSRSSYPMDEAAAWMPRLSPFMKITARSTARAMAPQQIRSIYLWVDMARLPVSSCSRRCS